MKGGYSGIMGEFLLSKQDKNIEIMANQLRILVGVIAFLLLLLFGWLSLQDTLFILFNSNQSAEIVFKFAITIYFVSWLHGPQFDLKDMKYFILVAPEKGKLPMMAVSIIIMAGVLFALLCISRDIKVFSLLLLVFRSIDRFGNIYLSKKYEPALDSSIEIFKKQNDFIEVLICEAVRGIARSKQISNRYIFSLTLIILMIIFAFTNLNIKISALIRLDDPELLFSLTVLFYVIVHEIWTWYVRLNRHQYIQSLVKINEEYYLYKKE